MNFQVAPFIGINFGIVKTGYDDRVVTVSDLRGRGVVVIGSVGDGVGGSLVVLLTPPSTQGHKQGCA